MNRDGHNDANFFVGTEVEHTPAHNAQTLFVVGLQDAESINWQLGVENSKRRNKITHIYFGANMSFPNPDKNNASVWEQWETLIEVFLKQGYWCTLDLDVSSVEGLVEGSLVEHSLFIPMISVKLPYSKLLGYNATVKLDDKDFAASNPGVWCHSLHDLMDRNKFTSWDKYTKDEVVK